MKVEVTSTSPVRKLAAVIGEGNRGIFFRDADRGGSVYTAGGVYCTSDKRTLEQLVDEKACAGIGARRTPVYEGDTLTITF